MSFATSVAGFRSQAGCLQKRCGPVVRGHPRLVGSMVKGWRVLACRCGDTGAQAFWKRIFCKARKDRKRRCMETLYPIVKFISDHSLILTALVAVIIMQLTVIVPLANYLEPKWRPPDPVYLIWFLGVEERNTKRFFQIGEYGYYEWPHGKDSVEIPIPVIEHPNRLRCVFEQDGHLVFWIAYPRRLQEDDQYIRVHSPVLHGGTALLGAEPIPVKIPWESTDFLYQPVFMNWNTVETWGRNNTWNLSRTYAIGGAQMDYPQQMLAEPFVLSKNPPFPRIRENLPIERCLADS